MRGQSLLDIGGGIGAIQLELLKDGLQHATAVDASAAFLKAAQAEAERLGFAERTAYQFGDFVDHAPDIVSADIVTLDRVICCYPDMHTLVRLSAERTARLYALVSPRDVWWMRIGQHAMNLWERVTRSAFRFFVHPDAEVAAVLTGLGLTRRFYKTMGVWQVNVWERTTTGSSTSQPA